nr:hypothetical protein [Prescottella equi]
MTVPPSAKTGESIQLSASISPVNATGTVQFKDGTANIGAADSGGQHGIASTSHTFATAGSKPIIATFAGSGGFSNSTSAGRIVDVSVPLGRTTCGVQHDHDGAPIRDGRRGGAPVCAGLVDCTHPARHGAVLRPWSHRSDRGCPSRTVSSRSTTSSTARGAHNQRCLTGGVGVDGSASLAQTIQVADAPTVPGPAGSLGNGSAMFGS